MTLENVTNIAGLFEIINKCKGNVELVSEEGDRINLKSRLSQYLAVAGVFAHGYARQLQLIIEDQEDLEMIMESIVSGKSRE